MSSRSLLPTFNGGRHHGRTALGVASWLIIIWALAMISLPIWLWTVGDAALPRAVSLTVILLAAANCVILASAISARGFWRIIMTILFGAWLIEYIGSTTGFPFGHYGYTQSLQPQVAGVPLLIPFAWLMMLPSTWLIGQLLGPNRLWQAILAAGALTAWDLFLDPQMVTWDFWRWTTAGGYFGIPWLNFVGWFASALLLTWLARPPRLPVQPLLLVYTLTWALQSVGLALFWAMPGPATVGCVAMGLFVVLAWQRHLQARQ